MASHRHSLPPPRYPPHKFRTHNHQSRSRPHINKLQSGFPALLIPSPICRLDQRHRGTGAPDVCCNPVSTACGDPFDRDRVLPAVAEVVEIGEFLRADVCSRPSQIPSTNATPSWQSGSATTSILKSTTPKPSSQRSPLSPNPGRERLRANAPKAPSRGLRRLLTEKRRVLTLWLKAR